MKYPIIFVSTRNNLSCESVAEIFFCRKVNSVSPSGTGTVWWRLWGRYGRRTWSRMWGARFVWATQTQCRRVDIATTDWLQWEPPLWLSVAGGILQRLFLDGTIRSIHARKSRFGIWQWRLCRDGTVNPLRDTDLCRLTEIFR